MSHRRPGAQHRAPCAEWRRGADDGAQPAAHDPLPQGTRHLRGVRNHWRAFEPKKNRELIDTGLDQAAHFLRTRWTRGRSLPRRHEFFDRIVRNVQAFTSLQPELGINRPRVPLWLTCLGSGPLPVMPAQPQSRRVENARKPRRSHDHCVGSRSHGRPRRPIHRQPGRVQYRPA